MGVHGLWRLLDSFGEVTQPQQWRGKRIAVDASIWTAQFRSQTAAGEDVDQRILDGFLQRILKLLFYGIEPIFVFDGPAASTKSVEHRRRASRRAEMAHALLHRRAREIVAAQVSAGVLDVHTLQPGKAKTAAAPPPTPLDTSRQKFLQGTVFCPPHNNPTTSTMERVARRKRRRQVTLAPTDVSNAATATFLSDAKELLELRSKGERCVAENVLRDSSTTLFMGPRKALCADNEATAQATHQPNKARRDVIAVDDPGENLPRPGTVVDVDHSGSSGMTGEATSVEGVCASSQEDTAVVYSIPTTDASHSLNGSVVLISDGREYECGVSVGSGFSSVASTLIDWDEAVEGDDSESGEWQGDMSEGEEEEESDGDFLWNVGTQWLRCPTMNEDYGQESKPDQSSSFIEATSMIADDEFCPVVVSASFGRRRFECPPNTGDSVMALPTTSATVATTAPSHETGNRVARTPLRQPTDSYTSVTREARVVPFDLIGIVELLDCCGVPFVLSPSEADAQCAFLNRHGLVDAVFTEDSDVLVHGAKVVLRGFFSRSKPVVAYKQSELTACGINKRVLVALAALLGCDYTEGIQGMGLMGALDALAVAWVPDADSNVASQSEETCVLRVLSNWRQLTRDALSIPAAASGWTSSLIDNLTLLQLWLVLQNRANWATVSIPADFPPKHVIEAFYAPVIDGDMTPFPCVKPMWQRLRAFAGSRGLLSSSWAVQCYELAQKEFAKFEEERQRLAEDRGQLKITNFGVQHGVRERWVYKKQSRKFASALSRLRAVQSAASTRYTSV